MLSLTFLVGNSVGPLAPLESLSELLYTTVEVISRILTIPDRVGRRLGAEYCMWIIIHSSTKSNLHYNIYIVGNTSLK